MVKKIFWLLFSITIGNLTIAQLFKTNQTLNLPKTLNLISLDVGKIERCNYVVDSICPTIIIFWLSSSNESIKMLDVIDENYSKWIKNNEFRVIAISNDKLNSRNVCRAIVEKHKWKFEFFFDDKNELKDAILGDWQGIPQLFIVDNKAKVLLHHYGYNADDENKIIEVIKKKK